MLRSASHKGCGYDFLCIHQSRCIEACDLINVTNMFNSSLIKEQMFNELTNMLQLFVKGIKIYSDTTWFL